MSFVLKFYEEQVMRFRLRRAFRTMCAISNQKYSRKGFETFVLEMRPHYLAHPAFYS